MKVVKLDKDLDKLLKKVSRTLYLSISILPQYLKTMLGTGYLICRAMDTIVDSSNLNNLEKKELLDLFILSIEKDKNILISSPILIKAAKDLLDKGEKKLIEEYYKVLDFVQKFDNEEKKVILMLVKGIASGMKMDIDFFERGKLSAFKTENELINYCHKIGGIPGIYWHEVYNLYTKNKLRTYNSIKLAYDIGTALQTTNILRDLSYDLKQGRCYIPLEDLRQYNLNPEDLLNPDNIIKLKPLLAKWIVYTIDLLDSSEKFLFSLDKSHFRLRAAIVWPVYWAMDSLYEIVKNNPLKSKSKISRKKIYLTMAKTPSILMSNRVFQRGYRFRRETLIVSINESL